MTVRRSGVGPNTIVGEVPSGSINSSNTVFTTSRAYIGGTLEVFLNGLSQLRTTDFVETTPGSGIFTFTVAPTSGDTVTASFQFTLTKQGNSDTVDGFNASSTPTANTLLALDGSAKVPTAALPANTAWTTPTLATGWDVFDSGAIPTTSTTTYRYPRYLKDSAGIVHMQGLAKNVSGGVNNASTNGTIFTLAAGYRPGHTLLFSVDGHNSTLATDGFCEIAIEPTGVVKIFGPTSNGITNNQWISISNISFVAEQ